MPTLVWCTTVSVAHPAPFPLESGWPSTARRLLTQNAGIQTVILVRNGRAEIADLLELRV